MKKWLTGIMLVSCILGVFSGCGTKQEMAEQLGIDLGAAQVLEETDTHGGFHGDGMRLLLLQCEDEQIEAEIRETKGWQAFPIETPQITALFYGLEIEDVFYAPDFCNEAGEPFFPMIENGYYFFYDRHAESQDPFDAKDVLERGSLNVTAAAYDADTCLLYVAELDT